MGYAISSFRDFESYLRIVVGLDEADIQLILKQYNSYFVTYKIPPGNYLIKDISEIVHIQIGRPVDLQLEYDDVSKKMKLVLNHFGDTFLMCGTLRFDEESFFNTLLGFHPYWDYKPPHTYTSDKIILNLSTIDKIHLNCDVIDGSFQDGVRPPILFSFVLD